MKTTAVSCKDVTLKDGFWKNRQLINRNVTMDAVYNRFYETGRIKSFECSWRNGDPDDQKPHYFWDSDVAKWIEGASYILMHEDIPEVQEKIESLIDGIENNMTPDGYYNVYFNIFGLSARFTDRDQHELYCAGHHFEAACAYYEATGRDRYLRLMERYADLIYKIFVQEGNEYFVTPGHPEIELALIRLYRTTKNKKYLDLCSFFVEQRGNNDKDKPLFDDPKYAHDLLPVRKAQNAEGHSVRMNYLMSGVCDLAYETDDKELYDACRRVFDNATRKRMYITGAQGSTYLGERYTSDYHLPNKTAYAETCASISMGMFAHRMSLCEADSVYADAVERTLYNGSLSGVSLEGDSFFYENPLEIRNEDYQIEYYNFLKPHHYVPRTRRKVFRCSCCPPNIVRLMASLGGYIYSLGEDTLFVHQYIASEFKKDGICAEISTVFPQNGKVCIKTAGVKKVAVRVPYYCKKLTANLPYEIKNGYAYFDANGENIELDFNLCARFVYSNTRVYDNTGRAAVMYGPVVYCAETADNETVESFFADAACKIRTVGEFHGVPMLELDGEVRSSGEELYSDEPPKKTPAVLKMIPYFGFANRGEHEMITYIPLK